MTPVLRYLIVCSEVQTHPMNPLRINVLDLIVNIWSKATPPFPIRHPQFSVLAVLTDCQGVGEFSLRVVHETTGTVVYRSPLRRVRFVGDRREAKGVVFRVLGCWFPEPGVYWVEFLFGEQVIGRQPIFAMARETINESWSD